MNLALYNTKLEPGKETDRFSQAGTSRLIWDV